MKKIAVLSLITTILIGMDQPQTPPSIVATLPSGVGPVKQVGFTPDGSRLVTSESQSKVQVWNTSDYGGNPINIDTETDTQSTFAISPDGKQIAVGHAIAFKAPIHLIDLVAGKGVKDLEKGYLDDINSLQYTPDKKSLLSTHQNGLCQLWDLTTDRACKIFSLKGSDNAYDVQVNPNDTKQFATIYASSNIVALWDVRNERQPVTTVTEQVPCAMLAYNKEGLLAVGGQYNLYIHDQKLQLLALYDLQGNKMKPGQYPMASTTSNCAPWMPNGITFMPTNDDILMAAIDTGNLIAYNLADESKTIVFKSQDSVAPQSVAVHPDGQTMAVGGWQPMQTYIYDTTIDELRAKAQAQEELTPKDILLNNIEQVGTVPRNRKWTNCYLS